MILQHENPPLGSLSNFENRHYRMQQVRRISRTVLYMGRANYNRIFVRNWAPVVTRNLS